MLIAIFVPALLGIVQDKLPRTESFLVHRFERAFASYPTQSSHLLLPFLVGTILFFVGVVSEQLPCELLKSPSSTSSSLVRLFARLDCLSRFYS
jgi:hypothetical protein